MFFLDRALMIGGGIGAHVDPGVTPSDMANSRDGEVPTS